MLGDVVADPYATLMAEHGFKSLIEMLKQACREGIDAVPAAPPELTAFIAAMEATPAWLDMNLVGEGARQSRIPAAFLAPFVTRGAFVATFMNSYAALPMALTGALGGRRAARRVNETSSFFAVTALPGALDRHGPGFEAAAMVRLMHSMVRYNALKRSDRWDVDVYGIPVPQVDQMPAGLLNIYLLAAKVRRDGRSRVHRRRARRRRVRPLPLLPARPARGAAAGHARRDPRTSCMRARRCCATGSTTRPAASSSARRCPPTSAPTTRRSTAPPRRSRRATARRSSSARSPAAIARRPSDGRLRSGSATSSASA